MINMYYFSSLIIKLLVSSSDDEQLLKEIQSMSITRVTPAPQLNLGKY